MSEIRHIIILILTLVVKGECVVQISPGVFFQSIPNVTLYETSVPVLLNIPLQDNQWWLQNATDELRGRRKDLVGLLSSMSRESNGKSDILSDDGTASSWKFNIATRKHVKRNFVTEYELKALLYRIRSVEEFIYITDILSVVPDKNMESIFNDMFFDNIINMCINRNLSPQVVNVGILQRALRGLWMKLGKVNLKFAIPLEDILSYYGLPIIDCLFTPETIFVKIQVPLVASYKRIMVKRLVPINFAWNQYSCSLDLPSLNIGLFSDNLHTIEIVQLNCDPYRDILCYYTSLRYNNVAMEACLLSILNGVDIKTYNSVCNVICKPVNTPTLTQLEWDTVVLSHGTSKLQGGCNQIGHIENTKVGALLVHLPCRCQVNWNDYVIEPRYPCMENATRDWRVVHLILPLWYKWPGMSLPAYHLNRYTEFASLWDAVNYNWQVPLNEKMQAGQLTIPVMGWLIGLTILIFLSFMVSVIQCVLSRGRDQVVFRSTGEGQVLHFVPEGRRRELPTPPSEDSPCAAPQPGVVPSQRTYLLASNIHEDEDGYIRPQPLPVQHTPSLSSPSYINQHLGDVRGRH